MVLRTIGRRMRPRALATLVLALCLFGSGCGGKKPRVYHVGILSGLNNFINIGESFKGSMAELGYVEGKNVVYDFQKTNFEPEREKQILDKFVADKVDLIFGFNTEVGLEAKTATQGTGIPVVFAMGILEGTGLVDNARTPGGNITGVRYPGVDFAVKRFEILHEIVPGAKRFLIPYQKNYPGVNYELEVLHTVAASSGVVLIELPVNNLAHLKTELEKRSKLDDAGFDAVLYIPESLSTTKAAFEIIANYTRDMKIPVGGTKILTEDYGTLFSVSVDYKEEARLAAYLADKILKGANAGTIPVVSPEPYIVIHTKVAKELGVSVPEGLLSRANEVIR